MNPATLHWFALKADALRPLFSFVGACRQWNGPIKKATIKIESDRLMTTRPNALVATVNHECIPVQLTTDAHASRESVFREPSDEA